MFFPHTSALLLTTSATNVDQDSLPHAILIKSTIEPIFRVFVDVEQFGGDGQPTVTVFLETSHDGHWIQAIDPIQLTSEGSRNRFVDVNALGPVVRARTRVDGTTKPTHKVVVKLAANVPFSLAVRKVPYNTVTTEVTATVKVTSTPE